jgi:hypothetical protein
MSTDGDTPYASITIAQGEALAHLYVLGGYWSGGWVPLRRLLRIVRFVQKDLDVLVQMGLARRCFCGGLLVPP